MATRVKFEWKDKELFAELRKAGMEANGNFGRHVVSLVRAQIAMNGQIDTGAMRASVYYKTDEKSSYGTAVAQANGLAAARGVKRPMNAEVNLPESGRRPVLVVAVAAEYGIYQEVANSFLYRGMTAAASEAPEIFGSVYRKHMKK